MARKIAQKIRNHLEVSASRERPPRAGDHDGSDVAVPAADVADDLCKPEKNCSRSFVVTSGLSCGLTFPTLRKLSSCNRMKNESQGSGHISSFMYNSSIFFH